MHVALVKPRAHDLAHSRQVEAKEADALFDQELGCTSGKGWDILEEGGCAAAVFPVSR